MITSRSIEVFRKLDFDCSDVELDIATVTATSSFPICSDFSADRDFLVHAVFEATDTGSSLSFVARQRDCRLLAGSLLQTNGDHQLTLKTNVFVFEEDNNDYSWHALRLAVGNAFGFAIIVQDGAMSLNRQPRLSVLRLFPSRTCNSTTNSASPRMIEFQSRVNGCGQPLLHYLSSLDFDDAAGLLMVGTSRGDVSLVRFLPTDSWAPGSLSQELPDAVTPHAKVSTPLRHSTSS